MGRIFGARIQHPSIKKLAPFLVPESGHENLARFWDCICFNILRGNLGECLRKDFGTKNCANFLLYGCWILAPKSVPFLLRILKFPVAPRRENLARIAAKNNQILLPRMIPLAPLTIYAIGATCPVVVIQSCS